MKRNLLISILALCLLMSAPAGAADPILTIDTGGHKALINDVMFTSDGRYLVSASEDKTVRVWDVETGEIDRVIRGQVGEGSEGKIYAAVLSPDDRWLAVGGMMATYDGSNRQEVGKIRLIDFRTGEIQRLLKGHDNVINGLAFSPDGRKLISGSSDNTARIWDVETGRTLHTLRGHSERIYAVAFSPDGRRAVTGSDDDTLRLWDVRTGEQIEELTGHEDNVVSAVFTPDGQYLLSGSDDKTLRLWDGKTGRLVKVLARQNRTVGSLSMSPDGKFVLTGLGYGSGEMANNIFSIPTGEKRLSFTRHKNIVLATGISPDGRLAATGGGDDKEIYLWDTRTGAVRQMLVGKGKSVWSVGFGKDGRSVAWGKESGQSNLFGHGELEQEFRIRESGNEYKLSLGESLTGDSGYIRGIDSAGTISIRTPNGKNHPTLQILHNGQIHREISRETNGDDFYCMTLTPNEKIIIAGTSWELIAFDANSGNELRKFIGHTGVVWGVAVSPDGKRLVSGSADQTVKLWDIATGRNLLTIFHGSDNEWVAWTPEGYYDSSLNGDRYIGWHLNRGPDRSALHYPASQFADKFRKPLVAAAYVETGGDLAKALALAEQRRPGRQQVERADAGDITETLPPRVFFTAPVTDQETRNDTICVTAGAESLTAAPVTDIWFVLNGRQTRGITRKKSSLDPKKTLSGRKASVEQCFELEEGRNQIALFAATRDGRSQPEILKVTRAAVQARQEDVFKPDLYVLSIGVSEYANPAYNLNVAHLDAEAVADAFRIQKGRLYRNVHVKLLTDRRATADNILDGLDWILKESTQKDLSVIFIAGHGENDAGNNYYFIPHDGDIDRLRRTGVRWYDFEDVISRLPSKTLMMVDTCRSGNITGTRRRGAADNTEALRELMKASPGLIVMAASTGQEFSIEKPEWGHGAFTKALIEGLRDFKADYDNNRSLDIKELDLYITQRVKQLTNGKQHATTEIPKIMPNFPIAVR